jgi:hypothetical protein
MVDGDRRVWARVPFSRKVLVASAGRQIACQATDLSAGGMCLYGQAELKPNQPVTLTLSISNTKRVGIEARVVRRTNVASRPAWGLMFERVGETLRGQLQSYVEGKRQRLRGGGELEETRAAPLKRVGSGVYRLRGVEKNTARGARAAEAALRRVPTGPRQPSSAKPKAQSTEPPSPPQAAPADQPAQKRYDSLPDFAGVGDLYRAALKDLKND